MINKKSRKYENKRKKKLKIKFIDYDEPQKINKNLIPSILLKKYNVVEDNNPDIVICSMWGNDHIDVEVPKIYCSGEAFVDNRICYDLSISLHICNEPNQFQINLISINEYDCEHVYDFLNNDLSKFKKYIDSPKIKFCAFMYQNKYPRERVWFARKLMKYKFVDCLGRILNNTKLDDSKTRYVPDWRSKQLDIYKDYKFVIAFENKSCDGNLTEKILSPLLVGSIPIYCGVPDIKDYINPECFINVNDFDSFEDCIEYVKKVDNDDELYQKYINARPILASSKLHNMIGDKLEKWLLLNVEKILSPNYKPIGKLSGYKRLKAIWLNRYWKIKQRVIYKFYVLLELLGVK